MKNFYLLTNDELNQFEISGTSLNDAVNNAECTSFAFNGAVSEYRS